MKIHGDNFYCLKKRAFQVAVETKQKSLKECNIFSLYSFSYFG